jgi:hypothetical protein
VHRGVIAYFIILAVLVVIAAYLYFSEGSKVLPATTTVSAGSTTSVSTTVLPNTTAANTTTQSTTSIYFASCISKNSTVQIFNGNFSTGTYAGWNVVGPGFGAVPFNITKANADGAYYAAPWNGYVGSFVATDYNSGLALQAGNLTSDVFNASELYLNFKIISSASSLLYVQILENGKPVITDHYNTYVSPPGVANPQSTFVNASIPLATVLCKPVGIRLVAGVTGKSSEGTGYIAAGDFYLSKTPANNPTQPTNQTFGG